MKQTELPLYPKISSIYNKIMQLAIAIVFIIVLMNLWVGIGNRDKTAIDQHFRYLSHEYLQQAAISVRVLLENNEAKVLKEYINSLSSMSFIQSVHLYDETGQVIASSVSLSASDELKTESGLLLNESTINDLYGISPQKPNLSKIFQPFVQEIRTTKLLGYLRITVEKSIINDPLYLVSNERQKLFRFMLILAGCVGFFLTRGFNRFSRQGYRVTKN